MSKGSARAALLAVAAAVCSATAVVAQAPKERTYAWFGEVLGVDPKTRTMTVRAQIEEPVLRYATEYKPGEKIMVTWMVDQGDGITVLWAPRYDVLKAFPTGNVLAAEFISVDAGARTMTFKSVVPESLAAEANALQPGRWVRGTASPDQPGSILALAVSERPKAKPKVVAAPPPPKAPAQPGLPGSWVVEASLGAKPIISECTLTLDGAKLGGSCATQFGKGEVTGDVNGTMVSFQFTVEAQGMTILFVHTGTLDPSGLSMKGDVAILGNKAGFSATKQ